MHSEYGLRKNARGAWLTLALAFAFIMAAANVPLAAQTPVKDTIKIDQGTLLGTTIGSAGKEVHVYRGIPYAAPPIGELRWRPPIQHAPWQGVRQATEYGPACAQYYKPDLAKVDAAKINENCLYLNVNTAAKTTGDKLPVMVWLHGGGLDTGSANTEVANSPNLPLHGVVVVTVNHRLGAFSLFANAGLSVESPTGASGNYGMQDLIAALQWVQWNITAFGGDPARVTIFGEGGGGQKVLWLLASPLAKGLFQRAILESGTSRNYVATQTLTENNTKIDTEWEAYNVSNRFVDRLGARTVAQMRAKTWQQIVDAMPAPPVGTEKIPVKDDRMHPAIDAWSLTDHPVNILDEAIGSDVPVRGGGDADENTMFVGYTADWLPALSHRKSNLYVYQFTHVPTNWKKAGLVAPHGMEVRYQFGELGGKWNAPAGMPADPGLNKDDQTVAEDTMQMWVNFATTGNPSVTGLIDWPAFKLVAGQDKYVVIDTKPEVRSGFLESFKPGK